MKIIYSKYEVFLCVVEKGGLTAAAEELGCTQSNITHVLRTLEDEFGFTLLTRGRSGAALTPEGSAMLPYIKETVEAARRMGDKARRVALSRGGEIRVGAFSSVSVNWLPGIIRDYRAAHSEVSFSLAGGDYHDIDKLLEENKLDVAFVTRRSVPGCRVIPLFTDPVLAVLPVNHPLASGESVKAASLRGENIICLPETSDDDSRAVFERAGFEPTVRFTTNDDYAIIAMVAGGLGISLMPGLLLKGHSENVKLLPLDPPAARTIALAVPERNEESPAVNAFTEFVINRIAKQTEVQ